MTKQTGLEKLDEWNKKALGKKEYKKIIVERNFGKIREKWAKETEKQILKEIERRELERLGKLHKIVECIQEDIKNMEVEVEYKKKVKAMKDVQKKDRFVEYVKLTEMEKSDNERGARKEEDSKEMTQQTKLTKIRDQLARTRDLHYTILEVRSNHERELDDLLETERIEAIRRLISWLDATIKKQSKESVN